MAALCAFAIFEVTRLSGSNLSQEWSSFKESFRLAPEEEHLHSDFWFDPSYGEFLQGLQTRTPLDATIAFDVPKAHELYSYEVHYTLAPRRIISPGASLNADYLAVYAPQEKSLPTPDAVPFGHLTRER